MKKISLLLNKMNFKTRSIIVATLVMAFLMMLVLTVMEPMTAIYPERIDRCDAAIEKTKADTELTDQEKLSAIKYYESLKTNRQNATKHYLLSMAILFVALLGGVILTNYTNKTISTIISAICLLSGIGLTYQYTLDFTPTHLFSLVIGIIVAVIAYRFWKNVTEVEDWMYYSIMGAIGFLILLNIVAPKANAGHALWINLFGFVFQPSEFVKILLILLGAASFGNKKRGIIYSIATIASCGYLILIKDLGNAVIMFGVFVIASLLLWDNKKLCLIILLVAAIAFFFAYNSLDYVQERFELWGNVMESTSEDAGQQKKLLQSMILAGKKGFGVAEGVGLIEYDYAVDTDTAVAGISIIFGRGMLIIVVLGYLALLLCATNLPITPIGYIVVSCTTMMLSMQMLLHTCGSMDIAPFTGVCAPFISSGGSNLMSTLTLMGFMIASLFPDIKPKEKKNA